MIQARSNEKSTVGAKISPHFVIPCVLSSQYATSINICGCKWLFSLNKMDLFSIKEYVGLQVYGLTLNLTL